jgi:hypothetical protein
MRWLGKGEEKGQLDLEMSWNLRNVGEKEK